MWRRGSVESITEEGRERRGDERREQGRECGEDNRGKMWRRGGRVERRVQVIAENRGEEKCREDSRE